jgi:hypothetical protein
MFVSVASAHAEVVAKDTVAYDGAVRMEKVEKANDYGEVSVRYVCYLLDVVNKKGEPRKVPVDKVTYESGHVTHIIYNVQDSGARRIAKAVNVEAVEVAKRAKAAAKAAESDALALK